MDAFIGSTWYIANKKCLVLQYPQIAFKKAILLVSILHQQIFSLIFFFFLCLFFCLGLSSIAAHPSLQPFLAAWRPELNMHLYYSLHESPFSLNCPYPMMPHVFPSLTVMPSASCLPCHGAYFVSYLPLHRLACDRALCITTILARLKPNALYSIKYKSFQIFVSPS